MEYKLAKALEDAKFPYREGVSFQTVYPEGLERPLYHRGQIIPATDLGVRLPILEELIKACGDRFAGLDRTEEGTFRYSMWMPGGEIAVSFSTYHQPDEAIAQLWLALQKQRTAPNPPIQ